MNTPKILIYSHDKSSSKILKNALEDKFELCCPSSLSDLFKQIKKYKFHFGFFDVQASATDTSGDVSTILKKIWDIQPTLQVVTLTQPNDQATLEAVKSVQKGAFQYLTLPLIESEIKLLLQNFFDQEKLQNELTYLREKFVEPGQFITTQTNSPKMKKLYEQIYRVSETNSNIYISGETGTGKSLLAKLIHQCSNRNKYPFIGLHCGAIPEPLLESELFGHEKGAFTDAQVTKSGKFELAHRGTIFLDEVGTMSLTAQIKLLQIIQDRKNIRIGGIKEMEIDVRVISASNEDLQVLSDKGKFRKDLYYRLNVFPIELPPLRERKEDIPLLVDVFLKKLNHLHKKTILGINPKAMALLMKYDWPGNIRELENILERAFILETSDVLEPSNFPSEFEIVDHIEDTNTSIDSTRTLKEIRLIETNRIEKTYLRALLVTYKGRISSTAKAAGVSTRQLHKLLTKHGIKKEEFKHS